MNPLNTIAYNPYLIGEQKLSEVVHQLENHTAINHNRIIIDDQNKKYSLQLNILADEIDIIISTLNTTPLDLGEEWVIAALIDAKSHTQGLFIHSESLDNTADLRIKDGAIIGVYEDIDGLQLKELNSKISYINVDDAEMALDLLTDQKIGALFISGSRNDQNLDQTNQNLAFIPINLKEMIPPAGSNAIAVLCRKQNIDLRKAIQKIHNKEVSQRTNIERRAAQLLAPNQSRSYCELDSKGNYHLHISLVTGIDKFTKAKVSQNTTTQLIENTLNALNTP